MKKHLPATIPADADSSLSRLLRKNTSPARIAGFLVSNFLGLAIVLGALQFYSDANSIWSADDSFVKSDWLVINKESDLRQYIPEKAPTSLPKR